MLYTRAMGSTTRAVWLKRIARILGVLAAVYVVLGLASFTVIYFLKGRAPADIKRVVAPRLDAIRRFTESAASRCPEVRNTGMLAQIQGTVPTSPAAGSDLDRWPELVDARVGCFWWTSAGDRRSAAGNSFRPLRDVARRPNGPSVGTWSISRRFFPGPPDPTREESATSWRSDPSTVDVTIHRPLPGDAGYVAVVVTLRRGPSTDPR